jgi:hypothetical protein
MVNTIVGLLLLAVAYAPGANALGVAKQAAIGIGCGFGE